MRAIVAGQRDFQEVIEREEKQRDKKINSVRVLVFGVWVGVAKTKAHGHLSISECDRAISDQPWVVRTMS